MATYVPLLHLCARHAFFGEQAINHFGFEPDAATAAVLARHDILLRANAEGLTLACPDTTRAALQAGAEPALELVFQARTIGASFSLVTAPVAPTANACLVFHSAAAVREDGGSWRLHAGARADASAWSRAVIPNRAAALAEHGFHASRPAFHLLLAAPAIAAALAADTVPRFLVRFAARSTRWKYYLLNDALQGAPPQAADEVNARPPIIVDLDGGLTFTARGHTQLPGRRSALTFISEQAIEMRQHPAQRLQLCERGEPDRPIKRILIKRLPNASVAAVGREVAAGSNGTGEATLVSEIYIR